MNISFKTHKPSMWTVNSAWIDLYCNWDYSIPARSVTLVDLWIKTAINEMQHCKLYARSSLHKKWLILANGVWIIDSDYRGEWKAPLYNFTDAVVELKDWEKICQFILCDNAYDEFERDEDFELFEVNYPTDRWEWWFGSTGS